MQPANNNQGGLGGANAATPANPNPVPNNVQPCPKPWIKVKVVDDDPKTPVDGIQVDMELPGAVDASQTTAGQQPAAWDQLNPAPSTAKLKKLSHASLVWEMVRIESA